MKTEKCTFSLYVTHDFKLNFSPSYQQRTRFKGRYIMSPILCQTVKIIFICWCKKRSESKPVTKHLHVHLPQKHQAIFYLQFRDGKKTRPMFN